MLEVGLTVSISQAKKEDMVAGGNGSEDGDFMVPARHDLQLFSSSARDLRCENGSEDGCHHQARPRPQLGRQQDGEWPAAQESWQRLRQL